MTGIDEYRLGPNQIPKQLGTIALDVAVTHSLNRRRLGRVALHSDPEGGERLLAWYQKRGMTILPRSKRLPPGPRRLVKPSDGHYCYYTVPDAVEASRDLDHLR